MYRPFYATDSQRGSSSGTAITAHAQLRYVERYIDPAAAKEAHKAGRSAAAAVRSLTERYGIEIEDYRREVAATLSRLKARLGTIPFDRYTVRNGKLALAMVGDTCVTTLPPHKIENRIRARSKSARLKATRRNRAFRMALHRAAEVW
jgi:hypothetical protein